MEFSDVEKRVFLTVGLIILVVLLTLFGVVRLGRMSQNQQELPTEQVKQVVIEPEIIPEEPFVPDPVKLVEKQEEEEKEEPISNLYRNYEYGFEVSYPAEWTRNEAPYEFAFVFGPAGASIDAQVQIWVKKISILEAIFEDKSEACTEIAYEEGVAYRCSGETEGGFFNYAEVEQNGRFYFLSVEGKLDEKFETFEDMLSSFVILEPLPE